MIRAVYTDKKQVVNILTNSFADNKSVNYIIKQDKRKLQRLKALMEYSFDICYRHGDIFLSDNRQGCALILIPERRQTTLQSILLDIKLVITTIGFGNISKAIKRESRIKAIHPKGSIYYLWFIGVNTDVRNKGIGSSLLREVIQEGQNKGRTICLETSTLKNIPWYEKHGFNIYKELDFGYTLYCMKLS